MRVHQASIEAVQRNRGNPDEEVNVRRPDIGPMNWPAENTFLQGWQKSNTKARELTAEEYQEEARIAKEAAEENASVPWQYGMPRAFRTHLVDALSKQFGANPLQEQKRMVEPIIFAEGILTDDWLRTIVDSSAHTNDSNREAIVGKIKRHASEAQAQCLFYFRKVSQISDIRHADVLLMSVR